MRRPRLFCPDLTPGTVSLPEHEARHLIASLRAAPGCKVVLFNGRGTEGAGIVTRVGRRSAEVEVVHVEDKPFELSCRLTLAVAMTRLHRQGYLIEKCTELGVSAIRPIVAERSTDKPDGSGVVRWKRRAIEAAKQSGRAWIPEFAEPVALNQSLLQIGEFDAASITHHDPSAAAFAAFLESVRNDGSLVVWVGPEGGWSDNEVAQAVAAGAVVTRLMPTVLRTETAAIAVCAAVAMRGQSCFT